MGNIHMKYSRVQNITYVWPKVLYVEVEDSDQFQNQNQSSLIVPQMGKLFCHSSQRTEYYKKKKKKRIIITIAKFEQ